MQGKDSKGQRWPGQAFLSRICTQAVVLGSGGEQHQREQLRARPSERQSPQSVGVGVGPAQRAEVQGD